MVIDEKDFNLLENVLIDDNSIQSGKIAKIHQITQLFPGYKNQRIFLVEIEPGIYHPTPEQLAKKVK